MSMTYGFQTGGQMAQPQRAPQNPLAQQALALGGPSAIQQANDSQYLADALERLNQSGAEASKTPLALGANLLADALLQYGRHRSNAALMATIQNGQNSLLNGPALPGESDYIASQSGGQGGAPAGGAAAASPGGAASSSAPMPDPGQATPGVGADGFSNALSSPTGAALAMPAGANGYATPYGASLAAALSSLSNTNNGFSPQLSHPLAEALAGGSAPTPNPNDRLGQMFRDLVQGGLSQNAASGLVGNFMQESGPNLGLDNPGEGAIGAANWRGPRAAAARAYFDAHGGPTIDNQAAFTLSELHGPESRALGLLNAATDPASAAAAGLAYERPAGWTPNGNPAAASGWNNRLSGAQQVYGQFGGQGGPGTPDGQPGGGAPAGGVASSSNGQQDIHGGLSVGGGMSSTPQSALDPRLSAPIPQDAPAPMGGGPMPPGGPNFRMQPPPGLNAAGGWGAPLGPPPAGGQGQGGGIVMQPVPIARSQFAQLEQLRVAAQRQPQLYMQQFLALRQQLQDQAAKPEEPEFGSMVNGQTPVYGKVSGRFYGFQQPSGAVVDAGPKMRSDGSGGFTQAQGTGWRTVPSDSPTATKQVNDATGEIRYVQNPAYALPPQGGHFVDGPNGPQVAPTPGEGWVTVEGGSPSAIKQVNQVTGEVRFVANPAYGSPSSNTAINSQGQSAPLPQAPAPSATDPKALIPPALTPAFNDLAGRFHADEGYQDYIKSVNAANALEGVFKTASGPNGIVAQAGLDNGIRAMTGLSAKMGSVNSLLEHIDLPDQLKGEVSKTFGGMYMTPEVLGQVRDMIRGYGIGHMSLAQQQYDQYNGMAHRQGFDLGLTLPQMQPRGNYSWVGGGGGSQNDASVIAAARAAIARGAPRSAVIQRTRDMGVDPTGL